MLLNNKNAMGGHTAYLSARWPIIAGAVEVYYRI